MDIQIRQSGPLETRIEVFGDVDANQPSQRLATIYSDGTVDVPDLDRLPEIARKFWDAIKWEGQTLRERCERAERGGEPT